MTAHHRQSMRAFLAMTDEVGALTRIAERVDPVHEIAAWLSLLDGGGPVVFEDVAGHTMTVTGNHLTTRAQAARALGVEPHRLQARLVDAVRNPLAPRVVVGGAPCQEVVLPEPDLAALPIPTFFEHETGPYITAGAIVAKDTVTGHGNLSIARLKPLGANRAFIGIAPNHHLAALARAARGRGEGLEIAVTLGNHPAVLLAACFYLGLGDDELEVAGALLGEPLEVVPGPGRRPCRAGALRDRPRRRATSRRDGRGRPGQRVSRHVRGLRRRSCRDLLAHDPAHGRRLSVRASGLCGRAHSARGEAIAAGLRRSLQRTLPSVREVAVTAGGAGRLHAVVSLEGARAGAARRAMFAVWTAVSLVKQVTVVDGDTDPWDPVAVEHAVATRMRPERDLVVVPGVESDRAEPLEKDGVVGKLGSTPPRAPKIGPTGLGPAHPTRCWRRFVKRLPGTLGARRPRLGTGHCPESRRRSR